MKDKGGASATADLTLRIAAILARSTRAESLPALLQAICEELDWDLGEAWLPVPDQELLQFRAAWHASPGVTDRWIEAGRGIALAPGHGLIGRVWTNGEPEWLEDIAHSEAFTRNLYAAEAGLNTACAFPFRAEGRVVGVGGLFCRDKREPDSALLRQLVAVGLQLGRVAESYEATLHSERYFLELTESTNDILAVIKIDGTIEYENSAVERVLGYQLQERIGRNVFDFIHPDDIPLTFDSIRAGMQEPMSVQRIEVRARHRNGHWVWLESVIRVICGMLGTS